MKNYCIYIFGQITFKIKENLPIVFGVRIPTESPKVKGRLRKELTFVAMEERKHFVLVHGACLGAWCWYKVETFLKLAGHHVSAIDLGASGVNSKRLDDEIASIPDYLQPLMEFMACLPQEKKVILVGHSYSGLCISLAMENFHEKISVAVFISAYMPHYKSPPAALIQEVKKFF